MESTRNHNRTEVPQGYYSLVQAADLLGLTISGVHTLLGDGRLQADRFDGQHLRDVVYIRKVSLDAYRSRSQL